jgi:hypothetical protein
VEWIYRPLLRDYCELAKGLNHEENGVSIVRSYPAWFGLNSKGVKLRAYKEVDGTLLLHLPGRGESTISNADGLRHLSPLHLGHGHLSIFLGRHTSHNFQKMWALIAYAIVYQFSGIASSGTASFDIQFVEGMYGLAAEAMLICHSGRDLDLGQEEEYVVKNSVYRLKLKSTSGEYPLCGDPQGKLTNSGQLSSQAPI